jgi:hypothetical protein
VKETPGRNGGTLKSMEKGETLNPNGRPKKLPELDTLLADVLGGESGGEAKAILLALVTKAKKGDVRAAEVLFDRGYGKAKQDVTQRTIIKDERRDLSKLSEQELELYERILDKIGEGESQIRESEA